MTQETCVGGKDNDRRVLIVAPAFWPSTAYGGPTDSITGTAKAMGKIGMTVRVLTTDADGSRRVKPPDANPDGLTVSYSRRFGRRDFAPSIARRVWNGTRWADVVHLNGVFCFSSIPTLLSTRSLAKPVLWSVRGALESANVSARAGLIKRSLFFLARTTYPLLTLHFTSVEEADKSEKVAGGMRSVVIPNGVEVPAIMPEISNSETLALLFVGRLHPIKGVDRLLEALAMAVRRGTDVRLTVAGVGDDSYVRQLRGIAEDLEISDRVEWVGFVPDLAKWQLFRQSHVLVLPSHSENFGRVVPEALAHGRAVIASRGTPWRELEERGCGRWVGNDSESLANAIELMRKADLQSMGRRGRAWVIEQFSWDAVSQRMCCAYEDMIERVQRSRGRIS